MPDFHQLPSLLCPKHFALCTLPQRCCLVTQLIQFESDTSTLRVPEITRQKFTNNHSQTIIHKQDFTRQSHQQKKTPRKTAAFRLGMHIALVADSALLRLHYAGLRIALLRYRYADYCARSIAAASTGARLFNASSFTGLPLSLVMLIDVRLPRSPS